MESSTFPIENNNSPFDKSIELIKTRNFNGALQLIGYIFLSLSN